MLTHCKRLAMANASKSVASIHSLNKFDDSEITHGLPCIMAKANFLSKVSIKVTKNKCRHVPRIIMGGYVET